MSLAALLQGHSLTPVQQETVLLILALFPNKKRMPSSCRTDPNSHSCPWGRKGGLLQCLSPDQGQTALFAAKKASLIE